MAEAAEVANPLAGRGHEGTIVDHQPIGHGERRGEDHKRGPDEMDPIDHEERDGRRHVEDAFQVLDASGGCRRVRHNSPAATAARARSDSSAFSGPGAAISADLEALEQLPKILAR